MKSLFYFFIFIFLLGCKSSNYPVGEDAFDTGTEFIGACLKGDFDKASFYMLQDSVNISMMETLEKKYHSNSASLQQEYKDASIIIDHEEIVNDSIHFIFYKNSFDKIAHKLKVLNTEGKWLVDFKYTFNGNL